MTDTTIEFRPYIPKGFEGAPTTEVDALRRAKAVLVEEERWMTRDWFVNEHPEVDPEDPFCNNWQVCAEGAVLVVTVGATQARTLGNGWSCPLPGYAISHRFTARDVRPEECGLYARSIGLLFRAGVAKWGEHYYDRANEYNDRQCQSRTEAIEWFDIAIGLAEQKAT